MEMLDDSRLELFFCGGLVVASTAYISLFSGATMTTFFLVALLAAITAGCLSVITAVILIAPKHVSRTSVPQGVVDLQRKMKVFFLLTSKLE